MAGDGSETEQVGDAGTRPDPASPGDDDGLSIQERYDLLSNRRRRLALFCLARDDGGPVDADDIARQVAAWEDGVPVEVVTYEDRRSVYTSLRQHHLPKLADAGAVDYDRDAGTTALTARGHALEVYPSADMGDDRRSVARTVVGVGALSVFLAAGTLVDLPLLAAVPDVAALAFLLGVTVTGSVVAATARVPPAPGAVRPPELDPLDRPDEGA